jgi:hypothetical protein
MNLVLPESVSITFKDWSGEILPIANILIRIQTFARHKNDIALFPYCSDTAGIVRISKQELIAEAEATYETGLMDYVSIESAFPFVEIYPVTPEEINKAHRSRSDVWTTLMKGENRRWSDMAELLSVFERAQNHRIDFERTPETFLRARDEWIHPERAYQYELKLRIKE